MPLLSASSRYAESINIVPALQGIQHFLWTKFVPFHELRQLAVTPLSPTVPTALGPLSPSQATRRSDTRAGARPLRV